MDSRGMRATILVAACLALVGLVACGKGQPSIAAAKGSQAPAITKAAAPAATTNVTRPSTSSPQSKAAAPKPTATAVHITANGRLAFTIDHKLTFGTSGKIATIGVKEGDRVTKGQSLARLDTASLDRAVTAAQIAVKAAELTASSAEGDRQQAEYSVKLAEADLRQMEDNVKSAGIDLQIASNSLTKISYPYTYSTFSVDIPNATVAIRDAQFNLNQATANLQPGSASYGDALIKFKAAQDSLTRALQQLGKGLNLESLVTEVDQTKSGTASKATVWVTTDIWTISAAQLAVEKAQMTVTTAQNAVAKTTVALSNSQAALD